MQNSTVDVLFEKYGLVEANRLLMTSGFNAGMSFAKEYVDLSVELFSFIWQVQNLLHEFSIGKLSVEKSDSGKVNFLLECSLNEHTAYSSYEGFLSGIMEAYIKKNPSLSCYTIRLVT